MVRLTAILARTRDDGRKCCQPPHARGVQETQPMRPGRCEVSVMIIYPKEVEQVNREHLNQRCAALLILAEQVIQPDELHLHQLARWAVDQQKDWDPRQRTRVQSTLDFALRYRPRMQMRFLTGESADGTETSLPDNDLDDLAPEQVGEYLISHLLDWTKKN